MLTLLEAYSPLQSAPLLPLGDRGAQTDLIQIKNIEGLGPVKGDINTSPYGSIDGESFVGSHVGKRNIVITLMLNPDWADWSMEGLRRLLYAYFMPKQPVTLVFSSDDEFPQVKINGYTESVEPNMFSKDPEIQISIICPDPYFTTFDPIVVTGNCGTAYKTIDYVGSISTGYKLEITHLSGADATLLEVRTETVPGAWVWLQVQNAIVNAANYFEMNSEPGQKYVRNIGLNNGLISNLLNRITQGSTWPVLNPGPNKVQVLTNVASTTAKAWKLTYYPKFGGI